MAKEINNQEDLTLKKIRYYQGTIKDFETFWNDKIKQGESETSPETKACKDKNADLNKAFDIIPVTNDDNTQPEPLTNDEKKEIEGEKKEKKEKKDDVKDDKKEKKDDSKKDESNKDDKDDSKKKDDKSDKKKEEK